MIIRNGGICMRMGCGEVEFVASVERVAPGWPGQARPWSGLGGLWVSGYGDY